MPATRIEPEPRAPGGRANTAPHTLDTANGNVVRNMPTLHLSLVNDTEASASVTLVTSATLDGYAVEDVTVEIAPGEAKVFGHFPADVFGSDIEFTSPAALSVQAFA